MYLGAETDMLPRRSSLSRYLLVISIVALGGYFWLLTTAQQPFVSSALDEIVPSDQSPNTKAVESILTAKPKLTHHHSNLSLEEFRDNMTLGGVNMSGLIDLIKNANDSKGQGLEMHSLQEHTHVVNPHPFVYTINTPHICDKSDIFLIIYIHTAPSHYKRRMVIRETWGNPKFYSDLHVRLVFVMGQGVNETSSGSQDGLMFESEQYHDIVQENFQDSYRNLTYKGIAALKWISTYCSHAKYVLKSDDDIFVNMFTLLRHLRSIDKVGGTNSHGFIMCLVWHRMKVMRTGKWKVDVKEWKDDYYPVYCSGSAFVMSMDVALRLHEVSYHVPFFWVDDFYVTGLLPLKASNITHKQFMSTYVLDGRKLEEKFTGPQWFTYIFSHVHNLNMIQSVWSRLLQLSSGRDRPQVKFALPGQLPDEAEVRRKEAEAAKRKAAERKAKSSEKRASAEKRAAAARAKAKVKVKH